MHYKLGTGEDYRNNLLPNYLTLSFMLLMNMIEQIPLNKLVLVIWGRKLLGAGGG